MQVKMNLRVLIGMMLVMAAVSGATAVGLDPTTIFISAGVVGAIGVGLLIGAWDSGQD